MDGFADQHREWQAFYSTVALASAKLAGLLFVSLSIHKQVMLARRDRLPLRLAQASFGDLL